MKKRTDEEKKIEFWVKIPDYNIILKNMHRNGMDNLSAYMRIVALADAKIQVSVEMPTVIRVRDARLEGPPTHGEVGKVGKRAAG